MKGHQYNDAFIDAITDEWYSVTEHGHISPKDFEAMYCMH